MLISFYLLYLVFLSYGLAKIPLRYLTMTPNSKLDILLIDFKHLDSEYSNIAKELMALQSVI